MDLWVLSFNLSVPLQKKLFKTVSGELKCLTHFTVKDSLHIGATRSVTVKLSWKSYFISFQYLNLYMYWCRFIGHSYKYFKFSVFSKHCSVKMILAYANEKPNLLSSSENYNSTKHNFFFFLQTVGILKIVSSRVYALNSLPGLFYMNYCIIEAS